MTAKKEPSKCLRTAQFMSQFNHRLAVEEVEKNGFEACVSLFALAQFQKQFFVFVHSFESATGSVFSIDKKIDHEKSKFSNARLCVLAPCQSNNDDDEIESRMSIFHSAKNSIDNL